MPGRFAHLKPDEGNRTAFWEENVGRVKELLDEVNNDVFDGKGKYKDAFYRGYYTKEPPLLKPYLFLETDKGSITVCVSKQEGFFTVIVENTSGNCAWSTLQSTPKILDQTLEWAIEKLTR